jgi:hypothetical protein
MIPLTLRREFPAPSLKVFIALQVLDVLTTLIGLRAGAREASVFVAQLMHLNPLWGLMISKIYAAFFASLALRYKRPRLIVFLNYWFTLVVTWNLVTIIASRFIPHI